LAYLKRSGLQALEKLGLSLQPFQVWLLCSEGFAGSDLSLFIFDFNFYFTPFFGATAL
jgi:hypothetical protein